MKQNTKKVNEGFTLVEILVVVVIIGILAAGATLTYFSLTASATATEAKNQIKNLHQSAQSYYTQFGSMPGDCYEEMETTGTIEMSQKVIDAWEFGCDWEFDEGAKEITGQITATSTESYDAGPGKQIIYDIFTGEYTGYKQGLVKQESRNRDKNKYSYDLGDNYSDRDGYEVVHSYDFVEEHLMEIVRVAGNFYYSQGWLPSIDELIGIERLRLDKAFLDYWSINVDWWISEGDLYGYIYGESKEGEFSFNVSNRNLEYYKY